MRRQEPRGSVAGAELQRLKAQEERLREQRVSLLRRELAKAREAVQALERELRLLGDRETARTAGRIAWEDVYQRLGDRFTTREMRELTGAPPTLAASIAFGWKKTGRIVTTGRGEYRKTKQRSRSPRAP